MEKQIHDKDCVLENLITKVNANENKLKEKDETIKDLSDKLDSLLKNKATEETEDAVVEDSEIEKTFCNTSDVLKRCPHCCFETLIKDNLVNHMKTKHERNLKCDYCEFIGKNITGLKAHMRKNIQL
jgi:uncharacterized phosphosugar-binding protein